MTEAEAKRRRNLVTLDLGQDLKGKVDEIAVVNNISTSHVVRMLVQKALASLSQDPTITIRIPETSFIEEKP